MQVNSVDKVSCKTLDYYSSHDTGVCKAHQCHHLGVGYPCVSPEYILGDGLESKYHSGEVYLCI